MTSGCPNCPGSSGRSSGGPGLERALLGLSAAMGVFLVFDKPEHTWLGPLAVAGGLGFAVWYPIWVPRRRARIEALIAQFPEETAENRAA